jgi:hypothetical protein
LAASLFLILRFLVVETPFAVGTPIGKQAQPLQEVIDRTGAVGTVRFFTPAVRAKRLHDLFGLVLRNSRLLIARWCGPR